MTSERILVADDEAPIVDLCVQLLTDHGYQVRGVTSGQEALDCLEAEPFDLLVVDIRMPDVDGLMVLRWGLELDPNLTTVVMTGHATMGRVIEALNSGARGFLLKPFGISEFDAAIQTAIAQRQKEQEWLRLRAQLPILLISQTMMTEGDVKELSRRLLEVVARQMGAERALLMLPEPEGFFSVAAALGLPLDTVQGLRLPLDDEILARTLDGQDVLFWDGSSATELEAPLRLLARDSHSLVLVPLSTGQKDVGVLALSQLLVGERMVALTPSDMSLLSIVGRQMATALENARLYATEQQRTAELARALDQQRDLDRLKNQFIQNVSHELRTPLAMILGYAELLSAGDLGEMTPEQQGPMEIIVQRSYVLRELIDNITAILESEIRVPMRELVSVDTLVEEAIQEFQLLADREGLALQGIIASGVGPVVGDAEHLRRVVDNLIANALKFTPAGGCISVRLSGSDGGVLLEVEDTGIGIASEHQVPIFDRFYQVDGSTRRTHGGCGLGLALVKEIAERHGGRVEVWSELGKGSRFSVWLPQESYSPR